MTLQDWMDANSHDDASFGELVGRDRSQISRIRRGVSRPPDDLKVVIAEKTGGGVSLTSWFEPQDRAA